MEYKIKGYKALSPSDIGEVTWLTKSFFSKGAIAKKVGCSVLQVEIIQKEMT